MMRRQPRDYYRSPAWCVEVLLHARSLLDWLPVVDPCAGDGAILAACGGGIGFDIEPQALGIMRRDALAPEPWPTGQVVMNPPYRVAAAFVRRALDEAPRVSALLRLSWLEPCGDRRDLLALGPDVILLPERPRFRSDTRGSDSVTSAWFCWPGEGRWLIGASVKEK